MIMLETILAILAAAITIFIAGLLVRKQNEFHEVTEELNKQNNNSLEGIAAEVEVLTGKKPLDSKITYLEHRMDIFNKTLNIVKKPTYKRRNKNVKRKKDFADD